MKPKQGKLVFFDQDWSVFEWYVGDMPYCYALSRDGVALATFSNQRDARECLDAAAQGVMRIGNATAVFDEYYLALGGKRWQNEDEEGGGRRAWWPDVPSPAPRRGAGESMETIGASR